jgi:hypothetical protein
MHHHEFVALVDDTVDLEGHRVPTLDDYVPVLTKLNREEVAKAREQERMKKHENREQELKRWVSDAALSHRRATTAAPVLAAPSANPRSI